MSINIDLNADLGEDCPHDERLLDLVTSASIACGAHAGDADIARRTLDAALKRGVAVGAHPGFVDRAHFGRREQVVTSKFVNELIQEQVETLLKWAATVGVRLRFVKPHGALYNQAQNEEAVARGVIAAVSSFGLPVLGQPGSVLARIAAEDGVRFVSEGFPDRRYDADGRLVPRSRPDAVLVDPSEQASQIARLVHQTIDTLCIHGDDPNAVANAEHVRAVLAREGVTVRFWG